MPHDHLTATISLTGPVTCNDLRIDDEPVNDRSQFRVWLHLGTHDHDADRYPDTIQHKRAIQNPRWPVVSDGPDPVRVELGMIQRPAGGCAAPVRFRPLASLQRDPVYADLGIIGGTYGPPRTTDAECLDRDVLPLARALMTHRRAAWTPAQRLHAARATLGMTQRRFAVDLGVTRDTVAKWESGASTPSGPTWLALRELARQHGPDADAVSPLADH